MLRMAIVGQFYLLFRISNMGTNLRAGRTGQNSVSHFPYPYIYIPYTVDQFLSREKSGAKELKKPIHMLI